MVVFLYVKNLWTIKKKNLYFLVLLLKYNLCDKFSQVKNVFSSTIELFKYAPIS